MEQWLCGWIAEKQNLKREITSGKIKTLTVLATPMENNSQPHMYVVRFLDQTLEATIEYVMLD